MTILCASSRVIVFVIYICFLLFSLSQYLLLRNRKWTEISLLQCAALKMTKQCKIIDYYSTRKFHNKIIQLVFFVYVYLHQPFTVSTFEEHGLNTPGKGMSNIFRHTCHQDCEGRNDCYNHYPMLCDACGLESFILHVQACSFICFVLQFIMLITELKQ